MKRIKHISGWLLIGLLLATASSCHDMKIGFLDAEHGQYVIDTLVIRKHLNPVLDKTRIVTQVPWATEAMQGIRGTAPIYYAIEEVTSEDGDAGIFENDLSIVGGGIMYFPIESEAPFGRYKVSLRVYNKDYHYVLKDAFTFIVEAGPLDPGDIESIVKVLKSPTDPTTDPANNDPIDWSNSIDPSAVAGIVIGEAREAGGGEGELSYQWYMNEVAIEGATGKTYTLKSGDEGKITRKVTDQTMELGDPDAITSGGMTIITPIIVMTYNVGTLAVGQVAYTTYDLGWRTFPKGLELIETMEDDWSMLRSGVRWGSMLFSSSANRAKLSILNNTYAFWAYYGATSTATYKVGWTGSMSLDPVDPLMDEFIIRPFKVLPPLLEPATP